MMEKYVVVKKIFMEKVNMHKSCEKEFLRFQPLQLYGKIEDC